mgnify:CR=1 FL=1
MNLESKWLEDFSALAATRSFSQAAERRFVTQPAFSRRIRSLEAALGLQLVNRSRTPIELTEAGQLFLVTARSMVEQLGEVVRHLHNVEGQQGEVIWQFTKSGKVDFACLHVGHYEAGMKGQVSVGK